MKITKRELLRRIEALEEWSIGADDMLTELNHALPDPEYDAKCAENAVAVEESLERHAVRLGLKKPKLKDLDQSVFDGLDSDYMFAAIDGCTRRAYAYEQKPHIPVGKDYWRVHDGMQHPVEHGYDTTDWQNSLIERDKVELTGSDLCRAMLERGGKYISGFGHHYSDEAALDNKFADTVSEYTQCFQSSQNAWDYFVPINNQGEPLTASEVGL